MNNTFPIFRRILLVLFSGLICSCNSWLDVKPSDSITEDELLSNKDGFYQALNGIYLDLNKDELYGATLLFREIEILAQRYDISSNNENFLAISNYDYKSKYSKTTFQNTWNKAYNLILSANKLLKKADEQKEMLGKDYDLIRGELFGLRAMLHFDLFRIFGPVLALNPKDKTIPYNTMSTLGTSELLTADKVVEHLLADLAEAERSLKNDPIIEQGPLFSEGDDNNARFRTLRLNYYAIKGLQARVYLYALPLDATFQVKAFEAASVVINENDSKKWFTFVSPTEIKGSAPDRIFSTEVLFMNQNTRRANIFQDYFAPSVSSENILAPKGAGTEGVEGLYAEKDIRYLPLWLLSAEKSFRCLYKYATVNKGVSNDLVPMIRLSEMYFIAAETAPTSAEGIQILNKFLPKRDSDTLDEGSDLTQALQMEYRREFFGEGQLFYYYKRQNLVFIPQYGWNSKYVKSDVYVVPLPDSEMMYR